MGLLDDAIREHLELKRRHGADEGEVSRLAEEVFGQAAAPPPAPAADPVAPSSAPAEPPPSPPPAAAEPAASPSPPDSEPAPAPQDPEPPHGDALDQAVAPQPRPFTEDEPWLDEPDEVPPGERLDHPRGQATTEFTPEDHAEARGEPGYVEPDEEPGEDVLEETPEFLQETPEHDRLWFEQRPPKDFDFGG